MRLGIVGAGEMGGMHARAFLRLEQDFAGVYDPTRKAAEEFSREYGAPAFGSLDELLDAQLDAVVVASPHGVHALSAVPALEPHEAESPVNVEPVPLVYALCEVAANQHHGAAAAVDPPLG